MTVEDYWRGVLATGLVMGVLVFGALSAWTIRRNRKSSRLVLAVAIAAPVVTFGWFVALPAAGCAALAWVTRAIILDATEEAECMCFSYTIRTDYGTGIEHDVDPSDCPVHDRLGWPEQ